MPPLEEGVASRKPWYLLPLSPTTVSGTGQELRSGGEGCSAGIAVSSLVLPLTPAHLGHRGDHIPPASRPWHQKEKLISQVPGLTDLELAFSELSETEKRVTCSP